MCKLLIDNISRSEELCNELAIIEKKKRELKTELEKLQENCEHNIIIVARVNPGYEVWSKCLFCGKYYNVPHELREIPNHIVLDAYNYKRFKCFYSDEEIYSIITNKAKEYLSENPNMQSKQLAQKLENFFN